MTKIRVGIIAQIVCVVLLLTANAFLGYSIAKQAEGDMTEQIRARMMDVARTAAALIDGDKLESLEAGDEGTPAYQDILNTLATFQRQTDLNCIYCVREEADGSFVFTVDGTIDDPAYFGEPVVYTESLGKAAKGTAAVDFVAYEDRWGRFYSAFCPVLNSQGEVAGIVGVDFEAAWYEGHTQTLEQMAFVNGVASLILAFIAVIFMARMERSKTRHVKSLLEANRYDSLTGLANMGYFFELASSAYDEDKAEGERPAMLFMDLLGMKLFNQKYGFTEGDNLLKAFADLLADHFGKDRCGRFGQDHFAVSTNADDLEARLDRFIQECAQINGGRSLPVCIGIDLAPKEGRLTASSACDRAKAAGEEHTDVYVSGYWYYDEQMMARAEARQYAVDNLDRAIEEGWIKVYFQPIVRAATGKVCDEEALARWDDPERGMLSPADFIPALEDAKLAYKLDLNVLEQTLAKMKRIGEAGLYVVPASINLSRSDFEVCDIVEEIRVRVDAAGIAHGLVSVEITESAITSDFDFMKKQIERFHELGFQVWMDDFGSEYSSLNNLQRLRFDLLKLDMSFMRQFENPETSEKSKIILSELMKMAAGLGIETVAEGVETQEQMDFMRQIGCNKLQGFFFTRPIPLESILKRYEDGTAIGFEPPEEMERYLAQGREMRELRDRLNSGGKPDEAAEAGEADPA